MNHEIHPSRKRSAIQDRAAQEVEVLVASQTGSTMIFDELQRAYSARLFRTILRITKNWEDAEDVLQDTFLRAYLAFHCFEGRSSVYSWLTRIAINSALMLLRRSRARPEALLISSFEEGDGDSPVEFKDSSSNPEQLCDLRQRRDRLLKAIRSLESPLRAPIEAQLTGVLGEGGCRLIEHLGSSGKGPALSRAHSAAPTGVSTLRSEEAYVGCGCEYGHARKSQKSRTAMDNLRIRPTESVADCERSVTVAERELRSFVSSVIDLFGSEGAKFLEDIWLDELAEMERTPEPTSSHWRLVSVAASSRLAGRSMGLNQDRSRL